MSQAPRNLESPFESRRLWLMAGVVFLLAAFVRLTLLAFRGPVLSPDSHEYLTLAENMLGHGAFSLDTVAPFAPTIRWPPLYPAFIAALDWTGNPSPYLIVGVQSIIDAATAVMLLMMARTLLPLRWAFFVALAYAVHPGVLSSSRTVLAETLFTAIVVLAVWTLSRSLKRDKLWLTALGGSLMGLAVLCRPIALLLPFILFGAILLWLRSRRALWHGVVLVGVTLLVITPWSIRSSRAAGRFVTVQDSFVVAALFYTATRWDWDQKDSQIWARFTGELNGLMASEAGRSEVEEKRADKILLREGIRNIRANPGKYFASRARQFPFLFLTSYDSLTGINQSYGQLLAERDVLRILVKLFLLVTFSLVPFVLGLVGLKSSRESMTAMLCASVWLYLLVFHLPLWVEPRYWMPAIPFLLVSAALGADRLWNRFGKRARAAT